MYKIGGRISGTLRNIQLVIGGKQREFVQECTKSPSAIDGPDTLWQVISYIV